MDENNKVCETPKIPGVLELAYIGDAVYELKIRKHLLEKYPGRVDKMHKKAVLYVSAAGQARVVRSMLNGFLTDEEARLVKRARNHKVTSSPRGTNIKEYKLATGFEALLGYLEISGLDDRLNDIVSEAIRIIEGK